MSKARRPWLDDVENNTNGACFADDADVVLDGNGGFHLKDGLKPAAASEASS